MWRTLVADPYHKCAPSAAPPRVSTRRATTSRYSMPLHRRQPRAQLRAIRRTERAGLLRPGCKGDRAVHSSELVPTLERDCRRLPPTTAPNHSVDGANTMAKGNPTTASVEFHTRL